MSQRNDLNNTVLERQKIQSFELKNVVIKDCMFKKQFDEMKEYYLSIPNDDILFGFRKRAGMKAEGNELGGWYNNDSSFTPDFDECFNTFGQWLSGLARIFSVTEDKEVLEKIKYLLQEWGKTIEKDGYFFYSNYANSFHYTYEKMVCGLIDIYLFAGLEIALNYLSHITDWAVENLERTRRPASADRYGFTGGNPETKITDNEWYTLSENLYRAYIATGDKKYKDFAGIWHYNSYWKEIRNYNADAMTGRHGFSHVNNFNGAAMAYIVLGQYEYLRTIENAYEILKKYQLMASGGYAPDEHMANTTGSNGEALNSIFNTFEVTCGSWAGFKLTKYLMSITGKAIYGEWVETLIYNSIGAALPIVNRERRGKTFYYADYRITGGRKGYYPASYPCCSGTFPQVVTEYYNAIYYKDKDSLYINLFIPSEVTNSYGDEKIKVEQKTNYPESDAVDISISCKNRINLNLKIRIPSWAHSDNIELSINGEKRAICAIPGDWINIQRSWSNGDIVTIRIPMNLRFVPIDEYHPNRAALMYGPVMMAILGEEGGPLFEDITDPSRWIKRSEKEKLHFKLKDKKGNERLIVPFYEIKEKEKYFVYNDILNQ